MLKRVLVSRLSAPTKLKMRRLANRVLIIPNYVYDARRFMSSSSAARPADDKERLAAHITMDYHRIEKGMALPAPRAGFGADVIERLLAYIPEYEAAYGADATTEIARNALTEYQALNRANGVVNTKLDTFLSGRTMTNGEGGTVKLTREQLFPFSGDQALSFVRSRRSVRQFTGEAIPNEVIEEAVRLAQRAPSVCNRQAARVYVTNQRDRMDQALEFQNGNRGFGDRLGAVFVITADMRAFTTLGERNQVWVDGGIFAMSLAMSLHAMKLGACMLNWSVPAHHDKQARAALGIDDHQAIITMMGAGYPVEDIRIAESPRRQLDDVLRWL